MLQVLPVPEVEFSARSNSEKIDRLEAVLSTLPQLDHQMQHLFGDGLYVRILTMPAGSIYTSKIHKTEHPFVVIKGLLSVRHSDGSWQHIRAPFAGITKPGTRRVVVVHEETIWATHHLTQETDLAKIEAEVIEAHDFRASLNPEELQCLGGM